MLYYSVDLGVVAVHYFSSLSSVDVSLKECTFNFVGKSNFFTFDRIYTIIDLHLCHQISSIRFMVKIYFCHIPIWFHKH